MKKTRWIALLLAALTLCSLLCGCQSKEAKAFSEQVTALCGKEVTLESWTEISALLQLEETLSDKDRKSLEKGQAFAALEEIAAKYKALEDENVKDIEEKIAALPAAEDIRLDSEAVIYAAYRAYTKATDAVKSRVAGAETVETLKAQFDQYKQSCWVPCTHCGGDGKVTCSLCKGTGSRKTKYTTPNGKSWDVYQDCPKTSSCGECKGRGGTYVEKN